MNEPDAEQFDEDLVDKCLNAIREGADTLAHLSVHLRGRMGEQALLEIARIAEDLDCVHKIFSQLKDVATQDITDGK